MAFQKVKTLAVALNAVVIVYSINMLRKKIIKKKQGDNFVHIVSVVGKRLQGDKMREQFDTRTDYLFITFVMIG